MEQEIKDDGAKIIQIADDQSNIEWWVNEIVKRFKMHSVLVPIDKDQIVYSSKEFQEGMARFGHMIDAHIVIFPLSSKRAMEDFNKLKNLISSKE